MNKLKLITHIESVGLNPKREFLVASSIILLSIIAGITTYFYIGNVLVLSLFFVISFAFTYIYLNRYKSISALREEQLNNEFISILSFFRTFINNGISVYQAFKELIPYCSFELSNRITRMIEDMDNDKTVTPLVDFSKKFNSPQIEQLMINIYQMIDEGNNQINIYQYESIFNKLREESHKDRINKYDKSLSSMNIFPLVGSGTLIVMVTFGILHVIGGMVNGI